MYLSAKSEVKKSAGSLSLWERVRERVFHPPATRSPSPSPSQRAGDRRPRSLWERVFLLLLLFLLLPACRQSPPVDQAPDVQVLLTPGPTPTPVIRYSVKVNHAIAALNITARHNDDGSITVRFGGDGDPERNSLPITDGWNYLVRLYRPRPEILNGTWSFPSLAK